MAKTTSNHSRARCALACHYVLPLPARPLTTFPCITQVQRDYAQAIAQLALYPPGREALLQDPTVVPALQQVVSEGWEEEARQHAESALAALADRQPEARPHLDQDQRHVML